MAPLCVRRESQSQKAFRVDMNEKIRSGSLKIEEKQHYSKHGRFEGVFCLHMPQKVHYVLFFMSSERARVIVIILIFA